jgi:hypothetical protein
VDEQIFEEKLDIDNLCFFKHFPKYVVKFSRRHCQKSKMTSLGLNDLLKLRQQGIFDITWGR